MFHNLTDHHPIPNHALNLLRQRPLYIIIVLAHPRQVDVHPRTFTRKHLGAQTVPAEIQRRAVHLIQHDRRQRAQNLHFEFRGFDDVDGGNEAVDDQGYLSAVVQRDGVGFADHADGRLRTPGDEDGVADGGFDFQHPFGRIAVVVFDEPFVALEFLLRRFLRPHAFRLLSREGRFSSGG